MAIDVTCGGCGARFKAPEAYAGKKGKCKKCGAVVRIPEPAAVGAGAAPPPVSVEQDLYDVADTPAPARPARPAAAVPPPPPPLPAAASGTTYAAATAAMAARGVVPPAPTTGNWRTNHAEPRIMNIMRLAGGTVLALFGLLLASGPVLMMMRDTTGKTIRFKGVFFGLFLIVTGGGMMLKALKRGEG
jgi:hypothetical protein